MNEQHRALYDAITDIDPKYIEESTKPPRRIRRWILRFTAAAAILTLLLAMPGMFPSKDGYIVAPGILKVYAHDLTEAPDSKNLVTNMLDDSVGYVPELWTPAISRLCGLPFTFEITDDYYPGMDVTFEVSVNYGYFLKYNKSIKNYEKLEPTFTIDKNEKVYWSCNSTGSPSGELVEKDGGIYAHVTVYANGVIAGYGILEIGYSDGFYFPVRSETVCFPMVDGKLQEVPDDYVAQEIAKLKDIVSEYTLEEKKAEYHDYVEKVWGGENSMG